MRDAVATELHIRAAGGEKGEESSESQANPEQISGRSEAQATPDLLGLRMFLKSLRILWEGYTEGKLPVQPYSHAPI